VKLMFNTPPLSPLAAACAWLPTVLEQKTAPATAGPLAAHITARRPQGQLSTVHAQRGATPAIATIVLTDSKAMSKGALGYLNQESEGNKLGGFRGTPPRGKPV